MLVVDVVVVDVGLDVVVDVLVLVRAVVLELLEFELLTLDVVVVVSHGPTTGRHDDCDDVVGPPGPTTAAEMPSV